MKFHVFQLDCAGLRPALILEQKLVIQSQSQFGHVRQEHVQHDIAENLVMQHMALLADQKINRFDDVQKHFVL